MIRTDAPSRLLPVPAPPHDPYSVMLAGHIGGTRAIGWRVQQQERIETNPGSGALVLSPAPAAARWLSEPTGSFGGLRPPAHVAVTEQGQVLVLDLATGQLRRFDPCNCRFITLPCVAHAVAPAIECDVPWDIAAPSDRLLDPRALATCDGDLFIADRGHHRVVRLAIGTWVPRGVIRLPHGQRLTLALPWHPTGLAIDGGRRLIVSDPINGRIDRFTLRGRWIDTLTIEAGASHLAVDCHDQVYVVVETTHQVPVPATATTITIELNGGSRGYHWHSLQLSPLGPGARIAADVNISDDPWSAAFRDDPANPNWAPWIDAPAIHTALTRQSLGGRAGQFFRIRFRPAAGHVPDPFVVTSAGARVLRVHGSAVEVVTDARADRVHGFGHPPVIVDQHGLLHLPCDSGVQVFDDRGEPFRGQLATGDRFERQGKFLSTPIDSGIESCQWHRIDLRGAIPPGCGVEVLTTSSEIELTHAEVQSLPDTAWQSCAPATAMERCTWDALIASAPGRYLWIRLVLHGDGASSPCVAAAIIEYPRISLRRYLPGVFGIDPVGADFTDRFTAIFDRTLRSIESRLDTLPAYFDPLSAPADAPPGQRDFLSWLGDWIGITIAREWPEERRRHYIKEAARLYCQRGTADGLRAQLLLLLGFDRAYAEHCLAVRPQRRCVALPLNCAPCPPCDPAEPPPLILEHFKLRRWLYAGHGRLGSDSELWGKRIVGRSELSGGTLPPTGNAQVGVTTLNTVPDPLRDPFHHYVHKFSVFVPARIRDNAAERRALERLIALEAPAHTQADIRYVEPRFRVGIQASIGLDGVIARTPCGVTLDASRLRQGTVLPGRRSGPHFDVGNARVGTTTRLT